MLKNLFIVITAAMVVFGCAGETTQLRMKDTSYSVVSESGKVETPTIKTVVFPVGTVLGSASRDQASKLAQIFVDSHNMIVQGVHDTKEIGKESLKNQDTLKQSTGRIEDSSKRLEDSTKRLEESTKKIEASTQQLLEDSQKVSGMSQKASGAGQKQTSLEQSGTAQGALKLLEQLSQQQGSGEISLFFPAGSGKIRKGSLEYDRLVRFVDYLSRESRGRKVLFIMIGSSSSVGGKKINTKLAKNRSEAPVKIIDKYLVNVGHEFYKVYGIGDMYSPKGVSMDDHQKFQHVRILAVYETDQIPGLPEEPAKP